MNERKRKIIAQLTEIESRWFAFTSKLEQRAKELTEASIPELMDMYRNDEDQFKRTYARLLSSITGQLNSIEEKAREIEEQNVTDPFDRIEDKVESLEDDELTQFFDKLRDRCSDRADKLETKIDYWIEKVKDTSVENYEVKYQEIMDEYNSIKDKFCCKQCGAPITIDKIHFITTHISCPSCQTQNTFEPSSRASDLDHIGLLLAEQRTKHLLDIYEKEGETEESIYLQIHDLEIERIEYEMENDTNKISEIDSKIKMLEAERKASIAKAPKLYEEYLKAKFEEWIKLVPELEEQNHKIYESWLAEHKRKN